jgi:hypothetical protein
MTSVSAARQSTAAGLLATARRHAAHPYLWPLAPRFNPLRRWYHRLAADAEAEVWLLTWLPGQGTDLHDHGGSSGAFVVVSGVLTEYTVTAPSSGAARLSGHTVTPGRGREFGPHHVHRIVNTGVEPAVSVHAYGPALREMTRYRVDDGRLLATAVERVGVDW